MNIETVNKKYAISLLREIFSLRSQFPGTQSPFVLFSDEWYILSGQPFPPLSEYGDVDLIENGVGQVGHFLSQFDKESEEFPTRLPEERNITIATGVLIKDIFQEKVIPVLNQIDNLNINLVPIHNHFFGNSVTVSGLLTGKDIIDQLNNETLGDAVWMSHRILNDDGTKTLDDKMLDEISQNLGCPSMIGKDSFLDLLKGLSNA